MSVNDDCAASLKVADGRLLCLVRDITFSLGVHNQCSGFLGERKVRRLSGIRYKGWVSDRLENGLRKFIFTYEKKVYFFGGLGGFVTI